MTAFPADEEMILLEFHEDWGQYVNTSLYLRKGVPLATNATALFQLEISKGFSSEVVERSLNDFWATRDPSMDEQDYFHVGTVGHLYDGDGQ